tara:strand:+ start:496 stop:909 length:414 start_codon:yes stop_codon:yes gene_type:complete
MGFTAFEPEPVYEQFTMPWNPALVPPDHSAPSNLFDQRIDSLSKRLQSPPKTMRSGAAKDDSGIYAIPNPGEFSMRKMLLGELDSNTPVMDPNREAPAPPVNDWYYSRMNRPTSGSLVDQMQHANEFDGSYGRWVGT